MKTNMRVIVAVALGLLLLVGAGIPVVTQPAGAAPPAAPPAAPTPITAPAVSTERNMFTPITARALTADYNTEAMEISAFSWADVAYLVDQGTVNTTTVTIQYSNDKVTWVNGPALVTDNAADASDLTRMEVFGQYMRFNVNVTNANAITWTISALAR